MMSLMQRYKRGIIQWVDSLIHKVVIVERSQLCHTTPQVGNKGIKDE